MLLEDRLVIGPDDAITLDCPDGAEDTETIKVVSALCEFAGERPDGVVEELLCLTFASGTATEGRQRDVEESLPQHGVSCDVQDLLLGEFLGPWEGFVQSREDDDLSFEEGEADTLALTERAHCCVLHGVRVGHPLLGIDIGDSGEVDVLDVHGIGLA